MEMQNLKVGRPRRYDHVPLEGFAHRDLGLAAAMLGELSERVYDQIEDLPLEALDFVPPGTTLSIARLVVHMAWAEASWVRRLTGREIPPALLADLEADRLDAFERMPATGREAATVISICRRVQEQYSRPALSAVSEIDRAIASGGLTVTVRGVMHQLTWHWTYHSGQIGLLRLLWGSDYRWTTAPSLGTPVA